jgi:hypothetical protein
MADGTNSIQTQVIENTSENITFKNGVGGSATNSLLKLGGNTINITFDNCQFDNCMLEAYNNDALADPVNINLINGTSFTDVSNIISTTGVFFRNVQGANLSGLKVKKFERLGVQLHDCNDIHFNNGCEITDNCGKLEFNGGIDLVGSGTGIIIEDCELGNLTTHNQKYAISGQENYPDIIFRRNTITAPAAENILGEWTGTTATVVDNVSMSNWPNTVTGYSTELQSWMDRVCELGGKLPTASELIVLDDYISSLQTNSLFSRMKALYFAAWGSSTCLRVNVANPNQYLRTIKTAANTRYLDWTNQLGYKSDGGSYVIDNFMTDEYAGIESDFTIGNYLSENGTPTLAIYSFGARTNASTENFIQIVPQKNATTGGTLWYSSINRNIPTTTMKGLLIVTQNGTQNINYKDGVKTAYTHTPIAPDISTTFLSAARNGAIVSGGITAGGNNTFSAQSLEFKMDTVSDTDAANLLAAINILKAASILP